MDKMNLTEFCKKLSLSEKRVELIAGFFHHMKVVKKMEKATADEFKAEFTNFCNAPAKPSTTGGIGHACIFQWKIAHDAGRRYPDR